ncbi:VacJ family lipoprotein [Povalibacter sp.]|uniref:MlaA family lipoprotein n=1 Tax=Povalibacter sp. TaxID=1962978 RepID=UPI002F4180C8
MSLLIGRVPTPVRAIAMIAVLLISAGCATTPGATRADDPWEGMNRGIYKFNDTADRIALKPVAKGYRKITPRWFRAGVGNFFSNLTYPATIVNQFLQGKPGLGMRDFGRFVMNTTVGVGGLLDVATPAGLAANDEDFGQTLAKWGVGSGPYLTLPFFGPSSVRDAPSRLFDYFLGPLVYIDIPWEAEWGLRGLDIVHSRAELLPLDATLQSAFDPYAFMRDAWVQQREFQIYDGNPPPEVLEEDYSDEEAAELGPAPAPTP